MSGEESSSIKQSNRVQQEIFGGAGGTVYAGLRIFEASVNTIMPYFNVEIFAKRVKELRETRGISIGAGGLLVTFLCHRTCLPRSTFAKG